MADQLPSEAELLMPVLVKDVLVRGNLMPPVRPGAVTTEFETEVSFCRNVSEEQFKIKIVQKSMRAFEVTFETKEPFVDCFGPAHTQALRFATTKLPAYSTLSVKNPLLVEQQIVH